MKTELELQKEFIENPELKEQLKYLEKGGQKNIQGVVIVDAFLKGIRDLGYKNTPYALNEINDNSMQAGAKNIHYEIIGVKNKINELIVYDDEHGMPNEMLAVAVTWGGTHRQGSRKGFGKYGYGLPSASLSLGKKYTVYSKIEDGEWHKITFDITKIEDGKSTNLDQIMSKPEKCNLPKTIASFEGKNYSVKKLKHGTIIHYEELDRISPKTINTLENRLMEDFGQTYFRLLEQCNMFVNDKKVKPIDICFATPGMMGYEDPDLNNLTIDKDFTGEKDMLLKTEDGEEHAVEVRWSRLPALFAVRNDSDIPDVKEALVKGKISRGADTKHIRSKVMANNHGIVIRRLGRRMDVVKTFKDENNKNVFNVGNNSKYWKCEINFPPLLDEYFSVNTSKQQIIPAGRFVRTLQDNDIFKKLKAIEDAFTDEGKELVALKYTSETEDETQKKESEILAEEAKLAMGAATATSEHEERKNRANKRGKEIIAKLTQEIATKKKISAKEAEVEAIKQYEDIHQGRPTKVSEKKLGPHAPFLTFDEHSYNMLETVEVILNIDHSFYKSFYMGQGSNPESRKSWDLFFQMFAQLFFKYTEDYQEFINSFMNELGQHLKTVSKKRMAKEKKDGDLDNLDKDDNELDDKIPDELTAN